MKIAFTSCMDAERVREQPVWQKIQNETPDVLMLLGDNIYMDFGLSFSSNPKWKAIFESGQKGQELFAKEMYRRYALQWAVMEFRNLAIWMSENRGPDSLMATWDDHDFAWNNSYGSGSSKSAVSPMAKTISKALFEQFVSVLKNPLSNEKYPELPLDILNLPVAERGIDADTATDIGDIRFVLMDERYYRTDRDEPNATVVSTRQKKLLSDALTINPKALTIVAGGSPLKHAYLVGHQGWAGDQNNLDAKPNYPDYSEFVELATNAQKPILYLAGDIHRNEWLGQIETSPIVQALSSAAALGRYVVAKYNPCYGVVTINEHDCAVNVKLNRLTDNGNVLHDADVNLVYGPVGWTSTESPQGDMPAVSYLATPKQATAILSARARTATYAGQDDFDNISLSNIDKIYGDEVQAAANQRPDIAEIRTVEPSHTSVSLFLSQPAIDLPIIQVLERACQRALSTDKKAVILLVHGFDKSFPQSIDQAFSIRDLYKEVEPILFSWAAGDHTGLLSIPGEVSSTLQHIPQTIEKLGKLLSLFEETASQYPSLKRIILARSLGARLLSELFRVQKPGLMPDGSICIDRVVLSAPGVKADCHVDWEPGWEDRVCTTLNANDGTLALLQGFTREPALLGRTLPMPLSTGITYFDCTYSPAIDFHHDYIFKVPNPDILSLHTLLLTGRSISLEIPGFRRKLANVFIA